MNESTDEEYDERMWSEQDLVRRVSGGDVVNMDDFVTKRYCDDVVLQRCHNPGDESYQRCNTNSTGCEEELWSVLSIVTAAWMILCVWLVGQLVTNDQLGRGDCGIASRGGSDAIRNQVLDNEQDNALESFTDEAVGERDNLATVRDELGEANEIHNDGSHSPAVDELPGEFEAE